MGPESTFVGRTAERALIQGGLERSTPGASVVCVSGPPGIGKTRLVSEALADLTSREVIWTRCWDGPGTPALWPWEQVLRQLGHDSIDLRGQRPGVDRLATYEAVATMLALPSGRGTVVVIDDLHWSDAASVELARFVARSPLSSQVGLIVTFRDAEASVSPAAHGIGELRHTGSAVPLDGLTEESVAELVAAMSVPVDLADVSELHARTAGNPYFVEELVRLKKAHTSTSPEPSATPTWPIGPSDGIRSVVEGHLSLVSPTVRTVLTAAAVQGQRFDRSVLDRSTGRDREVVDDALSAATSASLVRHDEQSWAFSHALINEVLIDAISLQERRSLHRAAATALIADVELGRLVSAETIATHLRSAADGEAFSELVAWTERAADAAADRLAWEDESRHLDGLVSTLREHLEAPTVELAEVLLRRCRAEKRSRRLEVAKRCADEALSIAVALGDARLRSRIAVSYPPDAEAIDIDDIADPDQRRVREEALDALGDADPAWRSRLQSALALSLYWDNSHGDRARSSRATAAR
ncbi:MAG: AAA family ATPase, partial [Actinomycetota bacterium]